MITNVISSAQELKDALAVCGCTVSAGAAKRILAAFGKEDAAVTVTQLSEAVVSETDNMFGWLEANDPIVAQIALRDTFDAACGNGGETFDELGCERREAFKWRYRARVNASAAKSAEGLGFTVLPPTRRLGNTYVILKRINYGDGNKG